MAKEAKQIRITRGRWWYCCFVGETYDVKRKELFQDDGEPENEFNGEDIFVVYHQEGTESREFFVLKRDCEIVDEAPSPAKPQNMVESPPHYQNARFETIEVIEEITAGYSDGFVAYSVGNALKYLARAPYKHDDGGLEDLRKAAKYLEFAIKRIEAKQSAK